MTTSPLKSSLRPDADDALSASELVEVLCHSGRLRAAADYRILRSASMIHERHEDEYFAELAEREPPEECGSVAELLSPKERYGPTGLERAIADVGAALTVAPARARELTIAGSDLRYRIPFTGQALAEGRIDLSRFLMASSRTALCSPDKIATVDAALADALLSRGAMSTARFKALVDSIVAEHDPATVKRRKERANDDRHFAIRPDRFAPGQARLTGTLPMDKAAEVDARIRAMVAEVHRGDPRTADKRHADALVAIVRGQQHLECGCDNCVERRDAEQTVDSGESAAASSDSASTPAALSSTESSTCSHPARPYLHIVVNLTTLVGLDDAPAHLDGQGVIDADTARGLLADAKRSFVRAPTAAVADEMAENYTPSRRLDQLVRAGELCCAFPGCNSPVATADLDHNDEFDHRDPASGGKTVRGNLLPLCRLHHRIKTFTAWTCYQDLWGTAFFQSPTGHSFKGNAYTGRDMFPALDPAPRPPDDLAQKRIQRMRDERVWASRAAELRWIEENPPPF